MTERRYSFEHLKKDTNTLTKKEKIKLIEQKLNIFSEWKNKEGKDYTSRIFEHNFDSDAKALLREIEQNNDYKHSHDLNWYFNADNIPNQDAIFATNDFLDVYHKDTFETILFFNLLFKQIDELKDSLDKPLDYIEHLKKLPFNEKQLHLLLGMILYWHGGNPITNFNPKYKTILKLLEREFLSMYPDIYTHEKRLCNYEGNQTKKLEAEKVNVITKFIPQYSFPESQYLTRVEIDFEGLPGYVVQKGIIGRFEKIDSLQDSGYNTWQAELLSFYKTIPEQYILKTVEKGIEYAQKAYNVHKEIECTNLQNCPANECWERRIAITQQILAAIKKGTEIGVADTIVVNDTEPDDVNSNEFTTARQVLAMHFIFEQLQVRSNEIDRKAKAVFSQFLTGKNYKNIYDAFQNPFVTKQKNFRFEDLQYIRKLFEDLGLSEIAKAINNQLDKPR